ncbi:hypothetical protein PCE1_002510 [Barthelona sp. PCE]
MGPSPTTSSFSNSISQMLTLDDEFELSANYITNNRALHSTIHFVLLLTVLAFGLDCLTSFILVIYSFFFDDRVDASVTIEVSSSSSGTLWLQQFGSIGLFIMMVLEIVYLIRILKKPSRSVSTMGLLIMKLVSIFLWIFLSAYPTNFRSFLISISLVITVFSTIFIAICLMMFQRRNTANVFNKEGEKKAATLPNESLRGALEKLDRYSDIKSTRTRLGSKFNSGQRDVCNLTLLIALIVFGTFFIEFYKLNTTQGTFLTDNELEALMSEDSLGYYGARNNYNMRVLFIILDGIRYDYFDKNAEMKAFLAQTSIKDHSLSYHLTSSLPSMSVPNWVTFVTGEQPEGHGTLGNLMIPETKYDNIFRQAMNFDVNRGLTASPWFGDIVHTKLPILHGEGTVPTDYGLEAGNLNSADLADKKRGEIAREAWNNTHEPYEFFIMHLSDADLQGHAFGVSTEWNTEDTYNRALTNQTAQVEQLFDLATENDVIILTSDHGQVDRGGHGGPDELNMDCPFVIYKKNSNLASMSITDDEKFFTDDSPVDRFKKHFKNIDVAPTINALLGLPVPRTTSGVFMDDIMALLPNDAARREQYHDLFIQKYEYCKMFFAHNGHTYSDKNTTAMDPATNTVEQYKDEITALMKAYYQERADTMSTQKLRNILVNILVCLVVLCLFIMIQVTSSYTELISVFKKKIKDEDSRKIAGMNKYAFYGSLIAVSCHLILSIVGFLLLQRKYGYDLWDSTMIHTPAVIPTFFAYTTFIPLICTIIIIRWPFVRNCIPIGKGWKLIFKKIFFWLGNFSKFRYKNSMSIAEIYLWKQYTAMWTVLVSLIEFVMMGLWVFCIPFIFRVYFVDNFAYRFRLMTVMWMTCVLMIGVLSTLSFKNFEHGETGSKYDGIFLLGVSKYRKVADSSRTPDEDAKLLAERNIMYDEIEAREALFLKDPKQAKKDQSEFAIVEEENTVNNRGAEEMTQF